MQRNAECLNDYWMDSESFSVGFCMLKWKKKVFCAWTVNSEHKNVPPSFMQSDAWTVNYLRSSWFQNVCLKNVFGVLRNVFCNDSEYSWKIGCRHHLAIQISFYNGVQIHSASIVLTCRLKLKHVSMYTPYRMMHQQLKVSHAVLAAVCLRCLIDCSYWTSSKRLHLYSLNLKCLRQHVFKCLLSMKFLIPFP